MRLIVFILICMLCLAAVPGSIWLTAAQVGTPHFVYRYTFQDNGDPHNPRAYRYYLACTYWGYVGTITVRAEAGRCPWVRFFKGRNR